jgi:hypothetical protein
VWLTSQAQTFQEKASVLSDAFLNAFGEPLDLSYRIFVVNNSSECTNVLGIDELETVNNLNAYPNPFSNKTVVSFNADDNGIYSSRLVNVVGQEVYSESLNVVSGNNTTEIKNNNFSKGIYFYTLSNGNKSVSRRIVIE